MNTKIVALAAVVAALAGASTAQAYVEHGGGPAQPTRPDVRALVLRSEALNARYHLGSDATGSAIRALLLRSEALNARYGIGSGASAPAVRALRLRGAAFNARYVYTAKPGGGSPVRWAGIGVGAALAALALLGVLAVRRTRGTRTAVA
jgi:hypothetical protein